MNIKGVNDLLKDLYAIRKNKNDFYNVNLKLAQKDLIVAKKKMDEYDEDVIKRLESWLSTFNNDQSEGIDLNNIDAANTLYSLYLFDQGNYMRLKKLVSKYTLDYNNYQEKEEKLEASIIESCFFIINQVLDKYFKDIKYDESDVAEEGNKAIKEAINTYKVNVPISFVDYVEKLVLARFKVYFAKKYKKQIIIDTEKIDNRSREALIKKLISMLKTNMSIYDIYNFLKLNGNSYGEDTINKCIEDIKGIIDIFEDSLEDKNVQLICNIYDVSNELARYIYDNKGSIIEPINNFIEYNKF